MSIYFFVHMKYAKSVDTVPASFEVLKPQFINMFRRSFSALDAAAAGKSHNINALQYYTS